MNKVVCNVCGTSYPENAAQCPICGFVRTAEAVGAGAQDRADASYTYVKGGRFSKANVRKRNQANQNVETNPDSDDGSAIGSTGKRSRAGAIAAIVILSLAIVLVAGYIVLRFFVPNEYLYVGLDNFAAPTAQTESAQTQPAPTESTQEITEATIPCTAIKLSHSNLELDALGGNMRIVATAEPADTTDTLNFASDDGSVAVVDGTGNITATGEGKTVIRVTCGDITAVCNVTCVSVTTEPEATEPQIELMLNRMEITFDAEGQSWMLYDGSLPVSSIIWSSDDNTIATIVDGKVVAVGEGTTTVYGVYEDQSVSCIIHCDFSGETVSEGTGGITEAGSDTTRVCKLYNPYGNAEDVTIQVNEEFTLLLVDENQNEISDATWNISDAEVCSYENGIVKGLKSGYAEVSATFEGSTHTCIVRVG